MMPMMSRMWISPPATWNAKKPSAHRMSRMMAMVKSISRFPRYCLAERARNGLAGTLFPRLRLNEPALLHGGPDEPGEQGMRLERAALELSVELDSDEPLAVWP